MCVMSLIDKINELDKLPSDFLYSQKKTICSIGICSGYEELFDTNIKILISGDVRTSHLFCKKVN